MIFLFAFDCSCLVELLTLSFEYRFYEFFNNQFNPFTSYVDKSRQYMNSNKILTVFLRNNSHDCCVGKQFIIFINNSGFRDPMCIKILSILQCEEQISITWYWINITYLMNSFSNQCQLYQWKDRMMNLNALCALVYHHKDLRWATDDVQIWKRPLIV